MSEKLEKEKEGAPIRDEGDFMLPVKMAYKCTSRQPVKNT
jgi:hypothetical protein